MSPHNVRASMSFWYTAEPLLLAKVISTSLIFWPMCFIGAIRKLMHVIQNFLVTVKAAPHECIIRTGLPKT